MHLAELIFFGCFIIFVIAILLLDTLVIDKKAHEVSMKEAGIWTAVWIILALLFSVFLWFHGDLVHGINNFSDLQAVTTKYASHIKLNPDDFEWCLQQYRHHMTIPYISGYLLEKTLSVDNLFVMMMIFTSFGVSKKEYQHVLNWVSLEPSFCAAYSSSLAQPSSLVSLGFSPSLDYSSCIVVSRCFSRKRKTKRSMLPTIL